MKPYHAYRLWTPLLLSLLLVLSSCNDTSEPASFCDLVQTSESGEGYMTVQDYCSYRHNGCPWSTAELEAQYDSCEKPSFDYDRCEFKRFTGCGVIQYERRHDESDYYLLSYDADTLELIGVISSTDSPRWCGTLYSNEVTIGRVGPFLPRTTENQCGDVTETSCCETEP